MYLSEYLENFKNRNSMLDVSESNTLQEDTDTSPLTVIDYKKITQLLMEEDYIPIDIFKKTMPNIIDQYKRIEDPYTLLMKFTVIHENVKVNPDFINSEIEKNIANEEDDIHEILVCLDGQEEDLYYDENSLNFIKDGHAFSIPYESFTHFYDKKGQINIMI